MKAVTQLFLESLQRYGRLYALAFLPGRHTGAALTGRRLLFLLALPLFFAVQLMHWLCLALDELLFPGYRRTPVTAPIFITGIPRSGTTYLHRALAADGEFCVFTTWEVLLAPSVVQRRCVQAMAAVDRRLGSPGLRLLNTLIRRFGEDLDDIHPVSLAAPEEDYLLLLPAASCFFLLLAFPFDPWLSRLPTPERLTENGRQRLFGFYHGLLQRHLYGAPEPRRLLSKNAAFAGWPPYLLAQYPDACIIICARHPEAALASQLRALAPARAIFGTDAGGETTRALFTVLYRDFYRVIAGFLEAAPAASVRLVIQEDMRADSAAVLCGVRDFVRGVSAPDSLSSATVAVGTIAAASFIPDSATQDDAHVAFRQMLDSPLRLRIPL